MLHVVDTDTLFRTTAALRQRDLGGILELVQGIVNRGYDLQEFIEALIEHLRHLVAVCATGSVQFLDFPHDIARQYAAEAQLFRLPDLMNWLTLAHATQQAMRFSPHPRIRLEVGLIQMALLENAVEFGELLQLLSRLEQRGGIDPSAPTVSEATPPYTATGGRTPPKRPEPVRAEATPEQLLQELLGQDPMLRTLLQTGVLQVLPVGGVLLLRTQQSYVKDILQQRLPQLQAEMRSRLGSTAPVMQLELSTAGSSGPSPGNLEQLEERLQTLLGAQKVPSTAVKGQSSL
jgi:DNA polymerase III gamma/tau subunit